MVILMATVISACASLPQTSMSEADERSSDAPTLVDILDEADKAMSEGDLGTAQMSYALAVERAPENVEALYKLGYVHHLQASPDVSVTLLRHALQADPLHLPSQQLLGMVLLSIEDLEAAERSFNRVLEADPAAWQAMNAMGVIRDLQARHGDARSFFESALAYQPRSAKITNNLGYSHYLSGDMNMAEQRFLEALAHDRNYSRAWSNLALLYARTDRPGDAEAAFRKVVTEHQAANNVGYMGILQGDTQMADEQLNKALRLSPSYYEIANRNLEVMRNRQLDSLKKQSSAVGNGSTAMADVADIEYNSGDQTGVSILLVSDWETASMEEPALSSRQLQAYLNFLGFNAGQVDGQLGRSTQRAVRHFQQENSLQVDGKAGPQTSSRLSRETIQAAQNILRSLGYEVHEADGVVTPDTRSAIRLFQAKNGFTGTGIISIQLLQALTRARNQATRQLNTDHRLNLSARG